MYYYYYTHTRKDLPLINTHHTSPRKFAVFTTKPEETASISLGKQESMRKSNCSYLALFLIALVVTPPSATAYGGFKPPVPVGDSARAQNNKHAQEAIIKRCGNEPSKQAMAQLFDEFDIEVYDSSLPKDQQVTARSSQGETQNVGVLPVLGLIGAVNQAVGIVQKIVSFFGKQYSERLVGSFTDNGYKKFSGSANLMHGTGLPYANVERFMELMGQGNNIPKKYWKEMRGMAKWAAYTTSSTITKQTLEFSAGKGGNGKVIQFYMVNDREKQKLEVFTMTVSTEFKLAPDVFVILEETSQFWGMKSSAKIRFEKRPASLKPDQVKFISDYFSLIALQELAGFLKVENGVPDIKPKGRKASFDVEETDLPGTWSQPKSQNLRATRWPKAQHVPRTRWVNNLRQPREKANPVQFDRLSGGWNKNPSCLGAICPAIAKSRCPTGYHPKNCGCCGCWCYDVYEDEDTRSYGRNNAPFKGYEDTGSYARNNAPFNIYGDEDSGSYARSNVPFGHYGDRVEEYVNDGWEY